jgi:hypothetical protein
MQVPSSFGVVTTWDNVDVGMVFYGAHNGATGLFMKLEQPEYDQPNQAISFTPLRSPSDPAPALIPAQGFRGTSVLALPGAVILPMMKPGAVSTSVRAGNLLLTNDGLKLVVARDKSVLLSNSKLKVGEPAKTPFVTFSGWKIAMPSLIGSERHDVIFEWPLPPTQNV